MDHSWLASFEDIYTAHSLQTDWWVIPGNHDYKGNVQAEIDYSTIDRRWNMPSRYFAKKMRIGESGAESVLLIFLDTTPWISQYYKSADHADNVRTQDTAAQTKWLRKVLSDTSRDIKWKLVFGHHPVYTGGPRLHSKETDDLGTLLGPIFDQFRVDAYICGHEHSLQHMKPAAGSTDYFVSGAGSETTPAISLPGITKFALSENGFIVFSVRDDKITVQIISYTGQVLYTTILKHGNT
jgi:3',5'-cyclic AMP phosphodiesterase CpdA